MIEEERQKPQNQETISDSTAGQDDNRWTCVLAVRDTDAEYEYLLKSLPSVLKLKPDEMIVCLDEPVSQRLVDRIRTIQEQHGYQNLQIMPIAKTSEWNFQLANIMWHAYQAARYDRILTFDVDSILTKNVMHGLKDIGRDDIAVISFTKRFRITNLGELIRYFFYRLRVATTDFVFAGIYWTYRPYFFDSIVKSEYQKIYNGIDTYLVQIIPQTKYRIITRKEIGVVCLTPQNEDLPWRQFQMGVWLGANNEKWRDISWKRRRQRQQMTINASGEKMSLLSRLIRVKYWDIDEHLWLYVYIKSICWQYPFLYKGYKWAMAHKDAEVVQMAKEMSRYDFEMLGSKYFNNILNWQIKGTGYVES